MVDPGRTLGEETAVTRVQPDIAPKIVRKKNYILMSMIQRQMRFLLGILALRG